jgi:hypothetical protein
MPDYMQGFYDSLAQGVQVAQHLQAAAQQQQQLDEEKRSHRASEEVAGRHAAVAEAAQRDAENQRDFTQALQLSNIGATTAAPMGPPASDGSSAEPWSAGGEGSYQIPAPTPAGPTQAGGATPATAAAPGMRITFRGQTYNLPSLDDRAKAELGRKVALDSAQEQAKLDHYGITLPTAITDEFQMQPGTKILPDHAAALAQIHDALHPKPAAPKELHFSEVTDDKGNVTNTGRDPFSGAVVSRDTQKGAGKTEAAMHPSATAKTATPGQLSGVEKDKSVSLQKSQLNLDTDLGRIQKAFEKESAAAVNNPEQLAQLKDDRVAAIRQAYGDHYQRMRQAQGTYEARLSELTGQDVGHNDWADRAAEQFGAGSAQTGAATGAAPAATPPAAKAAPKVATMDDVRAYGKKHNLTDAASLKAFQADGIKIGR